MRHLKIGDIWDYDWQEVFKYAAAHVCEVGHNHGPQDVSKGLPEKIRSFSKEDVKYVIAYENGINDEKSWTGIFKLKDGWFAVIRAGCDYTGWG
ncbi:MAG: hypothetical protein EHM20_02375 [Alphaproteobacteria bacterium]|nr:MAG: hypothetical protein EHM20_12760 [Alphaproteobacteria bacterium]RPJ79061.1 MAG: hypothetical protein EHM20_02375 [Alphaproteobacteria bacterium]